MQAVKLYTNKILQFLTGVPANTGRLYNGCKTVVVVVAAGYKRTVTSLHGKQYNATLHDCCVADSLLLEGDNGWKSRLWRQLNLDKNYYYFASAAVAVDSSQTTTPLPAHGADPVHRQTLPMGTCPQCCRPLPQEGDWVRPHPCKPA